MGDAALVQQAIEVARSIERDSSLARIDAAIPHHRLQRTRKSELHRFAVDVALLDVAATPPTPPAVVAATPWGGVLPINASPERRATEMV